MAQRVTLLDNRTGEALLADPLDFDPAALTRGGELRTLRRDANGVLREVIIQLDDDAVDASAADAGVDVMTLAELEASQRAQQPPRQRAFATSTTTNITPPASAAGGGGGAKPGGEAEPRTSSPTKRASVRSPKRPTSRSVAEDDSNDLGDNGDDEADAAVVAAVFKDANKAPLSEAAQTSRTQHSFKRMKAVNINPGVRDFVPRATQRGATVAMKCHGGVQRIFVVGGCAGSPAEPSGEVVEFCMATSNWWRHELHGHRLTPRHSAAAIGISGPTALQHAILVHGGIARGGIEQREGEGPDQGTDAHEAMLQRRLFFFGPAGNAAPLTTKPKPALPFWRDPNAPPPRRSVSAAPAASANASVTLHARSHNMSTIRVQRPLGVSDDFTLIYPGTNECFHVPRDNSDEVHHAAVDPFALAGHTATAAGRGEVVLIGGVRSDMSLAPMDVMPIVSFARCSMCPGLARATCTFCGQPLCNTCPTSEDHVLECCVQHMPMPKVPYGGMTRKEAAAHFRPPLVPLPVRADLARVYGPCPSPRFGHTATFHPASGMIVVFGGQSAEGDPLEDMWAFDPTARRWHAMPLAIRSDRFTGRFGHTATLLDEMRLIIVGGMTDSTSFVGSVAQISLNPTGESFAATTVTLHQDDDPLPFSAFASAGDGGDGASVVVFGGYGRHRMTKTQRALETKQAKDKEKAIADAKKSGVPLPPAGRPEISPYEPHVRHWTNLIAFPLRKQSGGAGNDASTDGGSSAVEDEDAEPYISEQFQKFIDESMERAKRKIKEHDERERQLSVAAKEEADAKLWLPRAKIDGMIAVFDESVGELTEFESDKVPTANVNDRMLRIKAIEDATADVRRARELVKSMIGYIPKPFRQTAILELLMSAKAKLKAARDYNLGWTPQGEAKAWLKEHLEFLETADEAVKSAVKAVRTVQSEVTQRNMAHLETRANKIRESRASNAASVQKLREEAIHRNVYGPSKRELAQKQREKEAKQKKEEAMREELSKTKKGRRELERLDKLRAEHKRKLREMKPQRGPAHVARTVVTLADARMARKLRLAARDHIEDLVDTLVPIAVQEEDAAFAKNAKEEEAAPAAAQAAPAPATVTASTTTPATPAATTTAATPATDATATPAATPAATAPTAAPAASPSEVPQRPEAAKVQMLNERRVLAVKVNETVTKYDAFESWYRGLAKAAEDARLKKQQGQQQAAASTNEAAKKTDAAEEEQEEAPGVLRSDRLGPLTEAMKAAEDLLNAVKNLKIPTNDPNRPPTEQLHKAVDAAQKLTQGFRGAEQYVRLSFLSQAPGSAEGAKKRAPSGSDLAFRPVLNKAPAPAKRASSAAPAPAPAAAPVATTSARAVAAAPTAAAQPTAPRAVEPLGTASAEEANRRAVKPVGGRPLAAVDLRPMPQDAAPVSMPWFAHRPAAPAGHGVSPLGALGWVGSAAIAPLGEIGTQQPQQQQQSPAQAASLPAPGSPAPTAAPPSVAELTALGTVSAPLAETQSAPADAVGEQAAASTTNAAPAAPVVTATPSGDALASSAEAPVAAAPQTVAPTTASVSSCPAAAPAATSTTDAKPAPDSGPTPVDAPTSSSEPTAAASAPTAVAATSAASQQAEGATAPTQAQPAEAAPRAADSAASAPEATRRTVQVVLPASLSDPTSVGFDTFKDDAAMMRLLRPPQRKETLFTGKKNLTPGQRAILERREANSHW